jgi:hypothetical protein
METINYFKNKKISTLVIAAILLLVNNFNAFAHCDTMDGPVVIEAMEALNNGNVVPLLKWVKKEYEEEIKAVFNHVQAVRNKDPEVKKLADRYFLETLIRLHREGEGAPYTGLKSAGTIAPCLLKADQALEAGSVDTLAEKVGNEVEKAIKERFTHLMETKAHKNESVEAGREYVKAYVIYVHFIEGVHNLISQQDAHGEESGNQEQGKHDH